MGSGVYVLSGPAYEQIYGPSERQQIAALLGAPPVFYEPARVVAEPGLLRDVDVVMGGWGTPRFDQSVLEAAPKLRAIFYGAGSVRGVVSDALWKRGIQITSAAAANAVPVAEFTLGVILLSLKRVWHYAAEQQRTGRRPDAVAMPGGFGSTVGIVSQGLIGQRVCEMLRSFDLNVVVFDPFCSAEACAALGADKVDLNDLFARSDVVSLHTPWLPETEGMIRGEHFRSMKPNATFVNTARGAVVREAEMIEVLGQRPDLFAFLDVTHPEPPAADSPLPRLPNVLLTPHVAGSAYAECRRMGRYMVEELRRYLAGEPLKWRVTRERATLLA